MTRRALPTLAAAVAVLAAAGCTASSADGAASPSTEQLTVFAAASLTDVLDAIDARFEAEHPGVTVVAAFAGSSDLASQIREGAPADVFLSADEAQMDTIADTLDGDPVLFATNTLTIAVPEGNPADVTGLADLADPSVVSVVCAPQVPCGAAAERLAALDGVTLAPASEEQNVTDVLGKVAAGQADAGLVYVTDVARASGIEAVPIDGADRVANRYPAAALADAADPDLAAAYVAFLAGDEARGILADAGFAAP
ncbi:molybdate ABC transporter substrate-binding protein [Demequina soli]|uniref:molybdate ABC transporter substrate-binding protein n=1 Tax=Demequina soli TaxID=1638987 RepID=UPI000780C122|nr:molybdate ABC transporter substrate-binding protein [Demequina soli]